MNQQQIDRYLERIGFSGPVKHDGDTLDRLIWAHISTVPFESLDLCEYGVVPSLNIDDLYEKFVVKHRGGYCFEQNTIFGQLLNDLGFPTYGTVVRLLGPPGTPLRPYAHKGLVSEAEGKTWYCDVGFGGPGPKGVVEIRDGEQIVGGQLFRGTIRPDDFFIERKTDEGWTNVLYFAPRRIEPVDFEPLNFYIAMQPNSPFRLRRTVNLTLPNGSKALSDKHFTLRIDGDVIEKDVQTPEEMEELLRDEFGIEIHIPRWKNF